MKIFVVSFNDGDNLAIENVLYELEARGHELTIYAPFQDSSSLRMFAGLKAAIKPSKELTEKEAHKFDVGFCSVMAMERVKFFDVYCFVYAPYINEYFMTDGADFLFTCRRGLMPRCSFRCASMTVGDPKHDGVHTAPADDPKRILFIDSGHMPFGTKGKIQIADTLLEICKAFPDYELCIKPRWLRDSGAHYSHKNTEHLYTIIEQRCGGEIPDNLLMLNEHRPMQELIDSSISVITLYSTVAAHVIAQGKGILVLSGWDNEDKWDIRNEIDIDGQREFYSEGGCVVDHRDVVNYLPYGLHASEEFIQNLYPHGTGASKRIADVMEHVWDHFLQYGMYPAATEYDDATYKERMVSDPAITLTSLKQERVRDIIQRRVAQFSYKLTRQVDFSRYYNELDDTYRDLALTGPAYQDYTARFRTLQMQIVADHAELLSDDPIDQSFVLEALYELERYDEILDIPEEDILCKGPYHYYLGLIYRQRREPDMAIANFLSFFEEASSRSYTKYPQEEPRYSNIAYNFLFHIYDGRNIPPLGFARLYVGLHERQEETQVSYDWRRSAQRFLPSIADSIEQEDPQLSYQCLSLYARYNKKYNTDPLNRRIKRLKAENQKLDSENKKLKNSRLAYRLRKLGSKVRGGIRCLREHGLKYTIARIGEGARRPLADMKRRIERSGSFRIWKRFSEHVLPGYRLYQKFVQEYGENAWMYLSPSGIGDAYIFGSLFDAYSQKAHPGYTPVLGVFQSVGVKVAKLFGIEAVPFSFEEINQQIYVLLLFDQQRQVHVERMHYNTAFVHPLILRYLEGIHHFNFLSATLAQLGLEASTPLTKPTFERNTDLLNEIFQGNGLVPGRTVLISPYAKTVRPLSSTFWRKLVKGLTRNGLCVCTNSNGEFEPPLDHTKAVCPPISCAAPFVEMAGAVIGLRSGFLDVVSSAKCLKISLHPKNDYKRSLVGTNHEYYSMSTMFGQTDQYDYVYTPEEEDSLLEQIVLQIVQHLAIPAQPV